jgi:hypothetical protein
MVKADAWVTAGLSLLRTDAHQRLTIERLCAAMEKTKGSFYHHFADISAFEDALLASWKQAHTLGPIEIADAAHAGLSRGVSVGVNSGAGVRERRRALYRAVGKLDLKVEIAIRAWAATDTRARRAQADVDETRVAYLASLWGKGKKARTHAELEYAAFLGLLGQHGEGFAKHAHILDVLVKALETT